MIAVALAILLLLTFIAGFYIGAFKPGTAPMWHIILHGLAWGYCLHVVVEGIV